MTDEQAPTDAERVQLPSASKDFAARVLAARGRAIHMEGDGQPAPRSFWTSRGVVVASAVVAIACVAALGVAISRGNASSGQLTRTVYATTRTSVPMGRRGVAVAEPGADFSFVAGALRAAVTQRAGNVFYRVEPGGPVTVETLVGAVQATDACFRVSVEDRPKANAKLMSENSVNAPISVVSVYQGEVLVGGSQRATAGQQVQLSSTGVLLIVDGNGGIVPNAD